MELNNSTKTHRVRVFILLKFMKATEILIRLNKFSLRVTCHNIYTYTCKKKNNAIFFLNIDSFFSTSPAVQRNRLFSFSIFNLVVFAIWVIVLTCICKTLHVVDQLQIECTLITVFFIFYLIFQIYSMYISYCKGRSIIICYKCVVRTCQCWPKCTSLLESMYGTTVYLHVLNHMFVHTKLLTLLAS